MGTSLKGVEVFKAGNHKGKPFTIGDLDDMVANFKRFQRPGPDRLQRAPAVVGHTEKDLHNSAVMKRGDVVHLYREGELLKGDVDDVDDDLAHAIRSGNYDDVSSEIYHEPPEEFRKHGAKGKVFRRLAIIGGDIPHVKGLNSSGGLRGKLTTCSEWPTVSVTRCKRRGAEYTTFSEESPMTRDEILAKLTTDGGKADVLATYSDEQLAETYRISESKPAGKTVDVKFGDFSEEERSSLFKGIAKEMADPLNAQIKTQLDSNLKALKRQRVDLFCESQLAAGRIAPADLDATAGPTLADRLFALDDADKIHTFTEGGTKRKLTQLDAEMRAIGMKPAVYGTTGSRVAGGRAGIQTNGQNREEAFATFAESKEEFLRVTDTTPKEIVSAWKAGNEKDRFELETMLGFTGV